MKLLNKLIEQQIPVNWKTLWLGWLGPHNYSRLITLEEITCYVSNLIQIGKQFDDDVIYLAGVGQDEEEKVDQLLQDLAYEENTDDIFENRKWRWVLLTSIFDKLPDDPLYGVMELTEFWNIWENPIDSPMIDFYKNEFDPKILYSKEKYKNLRSNTQDWILKEKQRLVYKHSQSDFTDNRAD